MFVVAFCVRFCSAGSVAAFFKQALTNLLENVGIPAQVLGESVAFQPQFIDGAPVHDHRGSLGLNWKRHFALQDLLLDRGILKGQEKFFVSVAHSDADIDFTIAALADLMPELAAVEQIKGSRVCVISEFDPGVQGRVSITGFLQGQHALRLLLRQDPSEEVPANPKRYYKEETLWICIRLAR